MIEIDFNEILKEYRKRNISWKEMCLKYGLSENDNEKLRVRFKNWRKRNKILSNDQLVNAGDDSLDNYNYKVVTEIKQDGSISDDRLIMICEEDLKNPIRLLELHNFDPDTWVLVYARNNMWHMQKKGGARLLCYQSKITAKPKIHSEVTFEDVDQWFTNFKFDSNKVIYSPKQYNENGKVLEVCLADMHEGKDSLSFQDNFMDSIQRFEYTIDDICERSKNKRFSKILFINLGDLLHFDSVGGKTTQGTQLQTNGLSVQDVFDRVASMMIYGIDKLSRIAPVEFISIAGNHDESSSYMLTKALEFYYKNNDYVSVDSDHRTRKFRKIGNSLVGWCHGQMSKANLSSWIQVEARKEYGETKYCEIHHGHFHSQTTLEKNGVIVKGLPSICSTDNWHYQKGFIGSVQSTVSFVWDLEKGLSETWNTNI